MNSINFNIRQGGANRTNKILKYLLMNSFELIVLTEFINNSHGKKIINVLENEGYFTQFSNHFGGYGSFIACKEDFKTENISDRWVEVFIPNYDLRVLAVYVPDKMGLEKNIFWQNILEFCKDYIQENILLMGDFNSCTKEDSENHTDYNAKDLKFLEELGWIDLWKHYHTLGSDKYTYYHYSGIGFRLDYAFISSKMESILRKITVDHDNELIKSKISDHAPIIVKWE
jgi:exodeoxyribonuclease-3